MPTLFWTMALTSATGAEATTCKVTVLPANAFTKICMQAGDGPSTAGLRLSVMGTAGPRWMGDAGVWEQTRVRRSQLTTPRLSPLLCRLSGRLGLLAKRADFLGSLAPMPMRGRGW